ncbi:Serine protease AprX [Thermoflexales bacterium]|nr:Serine protease AprX [Thermoflexales bacterium]
MRKYTRQLLNLGVVIALVLMTGSPLAAWSAPNHYRVPQDASGDVRGPTIAIQLSAEDYRAAPALSPYYLVDYGSFVWLEIPATQLSRLETSGLSYQRGETTIGSYNFKFDPLDGEPILPAHLQQESSATEPGLYLIQFIGPITDHWLADASQSGIKLLQYYAHNAYLAWGTGAQLERLDGKNYVRWSGVFQPAYKFNPNLNSLKGRIENVAITFYNDGNIERTLDAFTGMGGEVIQAFPAQPDKAFYTAIVALEADRLAEAARLSTVWAMDYASPNPGLDDESGDQISVGNYTGTLPFVGYRNWLIPHGVDGTGVVFADVDTGLDTNTSATAHLDIRGRIAAFVDYTGGSTTTDTDGHGTHTAGIIAGNGALGITDTNGFLYGLGMAPNTQLVVQNALLGSAWPPTGGWQRLSKDTVLNGAVGSNNSWYTGVSGAQGYSAAARTHDLMVRDANFDTTSVAEPIIMVFSAGNSGSGASTITEPKEAKNLISVGASENYRPDNPLGSGCGASSNIENIVSFSSRGPALDGRLLPNIAAPGSDVASLRSATGSYSGCGQVVAGQPNYVYMSGTSMAAPHVSGGAALITQWWQATHVGLVPSPAMVKALLINGASDMTGAANLPNNSEGWGRMNLNNVIYTGVPSEYYDQQTVLGATGETWQKTLTVADPTKPVKVSLVWTDAAGAAGANPALVNNLNLTVVNSGSTYQGNVFTGGWSSTGGSADTLNNIENVYLPSGTTGALQITIAAVNIAGDGIPYNADTTDQDFALVVYNVRADGGTIAGTVTNAAAGTPLLGAKVTATQGATEKIAALSGVDGMYAMFVPTGTYSLEAAAYGYLPAHRSGVEVTLNTTTTQHFSLTAAANYVISGTVTDNATGYPLDATITVDGEPFDPPVASAQTNPATGYYSLTLAGGQAYTLTVSALLHTSEVRGIGTPTGNQTQDFALVATTTNGGLAGWVRNYYTNDPIPNATVTVASTGNPSDQTDADGYFEIFNLAPGIYTATATANLYSPATLDNIQVLSSNVTIRTFLLPTSQLNYVPGQLNRTLRLGQVATDTAGLVISNTGAGALNFTLREGIGGFAPLQPAANSLLVVAANGTALATQAITTALQSLNYTYGVAATRTAFEAMTVGQLLAYEAVIYSGPTDTSTTANDNPSNTLLRAYLDAGGRVMHVDNDEGYYDRASPYYTEYLQANYGGDDPGTDQSITGEDIMVGIVTNVNNDLYPDYFTPGPDGVRIFRYTAYNNGAGVRTARNNYKTLYLAFDYHYLGGNSTVGDAVETEVMLNALTWLVDGAPLELVPWFSQAPLTGTLSAGAMQNIAISWNASVAQITQPGIYTATLKIDNNDPLAQNTVLPVVLTVLPPAPPANLDIATVGNGNVIRNPLPPYSVGDVVTLTAVPSADWAFSTWSGDLTGATNPTTITLTSNQVITATFVLACVPVAGVDFTYTPTAPKVGQVITFNGTAMTGTAPITYSWNFGDSSPLGSGSPVTHTFPLTSSVRSYTVTLTAENACGTLPVSKSLQVQPLAVFLPLIMR